MAIPSSITRFGKTEPFYLQLARGQIENHKHIFKFGFNPDINGTEKTDVEVRAVSSGSNNLISANFSMVYIKNSSVDTNNYSP
jgi:hypothetical protein